MPTDYAQTIAAHLTACHTAEQFVAEYTPKLPDELHGFLSIGSEVGFYLTVPYSCVELDAITRLLAAAGEAFGRAGWTRTLNYQRTHFDWKRNIAGVEVVIQKAESVETPLEGSPVLPAAFPILLKNESFEPSLAPSEQVNRSAE